MTFFILPALPQPICSEHINTLNAAVGAHLKGEVCGVDVQGAVAWAQ